MLAFEIAVFSVCLFSTLMYLRLSHLVRERKYFVFSLLCLSGAVYAGSLIFIVVSKESATIVYKLIRVGMPGAIMMVPFVVQLVELLGEKNKKHASAVFFVINACLGIACLLDFGFYEHTRVLHRFSLIDFEIRLPIPGLGYKLFGLTVLLATVYCFSALAWRFRQGDSSVAASAVGIIVLSISGAYDTLWAQKIIPNPLLPMTEFGMLAMIGGMAITLMKRFVYSRERLRTTTSKLAALEEQTALLQKAMMQKLTAKYVGSTDLALHTRRDKFLEQVTNVCVKNLTDPQFSSATLAAKLFMTQTNLTRKLKSLTGQTATDLIRVMRLEHAALLLEKNSATVTEIAFSVGFNHLSYFIRSFKAHFGVTPTQYRQTRQDGSP